MPHISCANIKDKKTCDVIHILAHLRLPMGKCILKDAPVAEKQSQWHTKIHIGLIWKLETHPKRCSNPLNTNRFSYLGLAAGKH